MAEPAPPTWSIEGEYFENCNCAVVCPCGFSANAPFTATPTEGVCDVTFAFHIDARARSARSRSTASMRRCWPHTRVR